MTDLPDPDTDPAGFLGGVARLMRANAEAATPGPWGQRACVNSAPDARDIYSLHRDDPCITGSPIACIDGRDESVDGATAAHIAAADPSFALAVADGLGGAAAMIREADGGPLAILAAGITTHWLAVARAYVGSQP